jgi:hypothetical protein
MKPRSRGADGRFIRELPDGTIDAVALGTIATGLVVGAVDHLPSAHARPADHHATPAIVPPLPESSQTPAEVAPPPSVHATSEAASHVDGLSTATAVAQTLSADAEPSVAVANPSAETPQGDTPPPLHETLGALADTISTAMQTLVDHVQANAALPDQMTSVLQHVGAMADSASALASDIAGAAGPGLASGVLSSVPDTLDHVLSAPPLPELPAVPSVAQTLDPVTQTVDHVLGAAPLPDLPAVPSVAQMLDPVTQTVDHVLDAAPVPELPAVPSVVQTPDSVTQTVDHVLGAAPLPELPAIPPVTQTLDHVLGAASAPDVPAVHVDLPASVLGAADSMVDHITAPIVETPPLPIGFLGQSYTEVHDPQDTGSHGLTSMLHGLV